MLLLGPGALCRIDAALASRIRRGEDLRGIAISCGLAIALGAGAYGAVFGVWRAPEMGLYVALKLPLLIAAIAGLTIATSAMLAALLRSRLSLAQTAVCILLSLAVTSVLLGGVAPISLLLTLSAPPPDPAALGLAVEDPAVAPSMEVARALLLWHVAVIAAAGVAGVLRLRSLLARLIDDAGVARRLLVSWLVLQLAVGAELSWLARPFFGKPHLPASFLRVEALEGNFLEELATLSATTFGVAAPLVSGIAIVATAIGIAFALRSGPRVVEIAIVEGGIAALGRLVPWSGVSAVRRAGAAVEIELAADATLAKETWTVRCRDQGTARALAARLEVERGRARAGPFRTAGGPAPAA